MHCRAECLMAESTWGLESVCGQAWAPSTLLHHLLRRELAPVPFLRTVCFFVPVKSSRLLGLLKSRLNKTTHKGLTQNQQVTMCKATFRTALSFPAMRGRPDYRNRLCATLLLSPSLGLPGESTMIPSPMLRRGPAPRRDPAEGCNSPDRWTQSQRQGS